MLPTDEQIGAVLDGRGAEAGVREAARPFRQGGKVVAYRLGNLIFTAEGGKRDRRGRARPRVRRRSYVALNAPECR